MHLSRSWGPLWILLVSLTSVTQAQSGVTESSPKLVQKNLAPPYPVQWTTEGAEISLIHVAWGPADSPEMQSKGRPAMDQEHPTYDPDRPYVLALRFRARSTFDAPSTRYTSSGLVRVKDVAGNVEVPLVLTAAGFVPFSGSPGVYDVHFDRSSTAEYWDMFPAAPDEKESLFQAILGDAPENPKAYFRILLRGGEMTIMDLSAPQRTACLDLQNDFAGKVGASTRIKFHLIKNKNTLSGTEQYERVGKTLWLRGTADTLGNFVLEEHYPKDQITGTFKGSFSEDCQVMHGYFSKPDRSRLLRFELRQVTRGGN